MKDRNGAIAPLLYVTVTLILTVIVACTGGSDQSAKPIASITSPDNGSSFSVGQAVAISFGAADVKGVTQVELTIDNQPVRVEVVDPPVNSFVASHVWKPDTAGSHIIQARAFNVDNASSDTVQTVVVVHEAVAAVTPTESQPEQPTATATIVSPSSTPFVSTPSPTVEEVDNTAIVTALVSLNIRTGPGLEYIVVGRLAQNEAAEIVGRDELSAWWQIIHQSDRGEYGWVAAGDEFSTAINADSVPVVAAPPLPAEAPATETPTGSSDSLKPTIFSFTADRYTITTDESVVLSWDLANATVAYLRYNDIEEGVVAPGQKTVSPRVDTVYTLVARNEAGETTAQVTIRVSGATPTPVPVLRDGKTRIANGQAIDFDQGIVQDNVGSGSDFLWDASQTKIVPSGGASGAMLSIAYDQIFFEDCLSASYGQPISGVDGSTQVRGCYVTNEGRHGKFYVSEWDVTGTITVVWQTWSY